MTGEFAALVTLIEERMAERPPPTAEDLANLLVDRFTLVAEAAGLLAWDGSNPLDRGRLALTEKGLKWLGIVDRQKLVTERQNTT